MNPTAQQQAIIEHRGGHALVQAVAGSGKTGTLVARVRELVAEAPNMALRCITYNRDAAQEFQARVEPDLPSGARVKVQTFHSLGYALTHYLVTEGWLEPATIDTSSRWLESAAQSALRAAKSRFYGGRQCQVDSAEIGDFLGFYDRALGDVRDYDDVRLGCDPEYFPDAVTAIEQDRSERGLRGFAHLLSDPVRCLREHPQARAAVANKVDEILVDEFQDVNGIQYELVRLIAGERARVVACGDPDQTIYAWRGAQIDIINHQFQRDYQPVTTFELNYTQRYGHEIALLASHVIRNNQLRPDTLCISAPTTPASTVKRLDVAPGRAGEVLDQVAQNMPDGGWAQVGVLCRLWSLAVPYRLECLRRDIPYRIEGNRPALFKDRTLQAARAVLQVAAGQYTSLPREQRQRVAYWFLATPPAGLNEDALERISTRLADHPTQGEAVILEGTRHATSRTHQEAITSRAQLWAALESGRWGGATAAAVLEHYARMTHLLTATPDKGVADQDTATHKAQVWLTLSDMAQKHASDAAGMADLLDDLERKEQGRTSQSDDALCLTTVHAAKGLQWDLVVIPGLSDGIFPSRQQGEPDIESERRLFYVALTRARCLALLVTPPDPQLDEYAQNRRPRIPEAPRASRFVYESSPGWEVSRVVNGDSDQLIARDPDCARRYLEEIGFNVA